MRAMKASEAIGRKVRSKKHYPWRGIGEIIEVGNRYGYPVTVRWQRPVLGSSWLRGDVPWRDLELADEGAGK